MRPVRRGKRLKGCALEAGAAEPIRHGVSKRAQILTRKKCDSGLDFYTSAGYVEAQT
jgi:hypothetical protein